MLAGITTGNATLIVLDGGPVLATDPWIGDEDPAYFGSWALSHTIPAEHRELIAEARYHWYSHGHPDHLNPQSLERYRDRHVLLPDHVGGRIREALERDGMTVTVLPDRTWFELTPRVRVMCITDHIQDAILLVDVGGTLFVNLNDAAVRACGRFIRQVVGGFDRSFLLKLSGYGDGNMINIFDTEGQRIEPFGGTRVSVGDHLSTWAGMLGCTHVIPSSSFHRYQRADSIWAQDYTVPLEAYAEGFDHRVADFVPPFATVDCAGGEITCSTPPTTGNEVVSPEVFGDDWSDDLERADRGVLDRYFQRVEAVRRSFGFVELEVGATRHTVALDGPKRRGITFAVPRTSLMAAVEHEIFDDMLLGNFMRTTFHGVHSLQDPPFVRPVSRYGDNGRAFDRDEVRRYLREYAQRAQGEWLSEVVEIRRQRLANRYLSASGPAGWAARSARVVYRAVR